MKELKTTPLTVIVIGQVQNHGHEESHTHSAVLPRGTSVPRPRAGRDSRPQNTSLPRISPQSALAPRGQAQRLIALSFPFQELKGHERDFQDLSFRVFFVILLIILFI